MEDPSLSEVLGPRDSGGRGGRQAHPGPTEEARQRLEQFALGVRGPTVGFPRGERSGVPLPSEVNCWFRLAELLGG